MAGKSVLCQLPHSPWVMACEIVRELEESDPNDETTRIAKAEITSMNVTSFNLWNQNSTYPRRLIVPSAYLLPYITLERLKDAKSEEENFKFKYSTYGGQLLATLRIDDNVMWIPRRSSRFLIPGKVHFIGCGQHNELIFAFILVATSAPISDEQERHENGYVYRVKVDELVHLKDYVNYVDAMKEIKFVHTITRDYETEEVVFQSSASPSNNIANGRKDNEATPTSHDKGKPQNTEDFNSGSESDTRTTQSPVNRPLTRTKVDKADGSIDDHANNAGTGKSDPGLPYDTTSHRRENYEEHVKEKHGISFPTKTKGPGHAKKDSDKGLKSSYDLRSNRERQNGDGAAALSSGYNYKQSTHKLFSLFANCFVLNQAYKTVEIEGVKKGDTVIVYVTESDIRIGQCEMCCIIGRNKEGHIGVIFDEPPISSSIHVEHSAVKCPEKCDNGRIVFIPAHLVLSEGCRTFSLISNENQSSVATNPTTPTASKPEDTVLDINYAVEAIRNEHFTHEPIGYFRFIYEKIQIGGIHGYLNSCYADATLFSMFAFTNVFDFCLNFPRMKEKSDDEIIRNLSICNILKHDIVTPLRNNGSVNWKAIYKLRMALSNYNPNFKKDFMDAEEFVLTLAEKVWDIPGFYTFVDGATDYVFQIFVTYEGKEKTTAKLHALLEKSFEEAGVKLASVPSPALIVKLPVCNGDHLFEKVLPDLELSMEKLSVEVNKKMILRAVICLHKNHYTCYVRTGTGKLTDWIFVDSKPGQGIPDVRRISDLGAILSDPEKASQRYTPTSVEHFLHLISHAYMCIYEPEEPSETVV